MSINFWTVLSRDSLITLPSNLGGPLWSIQGTMQKEGQWWETSTATWPDGRNWREEKEGNEAMLPKEPQLSEAVLVSPAQHQTETTSETTSAAAIWLHESSPTPQLTTAQLSPVNLICEQINAYIKKKKTNLMIISFHLMKSKSSCHIVNELTCVWAASCENLITMLQEPYEMLLSSSSLKYSLCLTPCARLVCKQSTFTWAQWCFLTILWLCFQRITLPFSMPLP